MTPHTHQKKSRHYPVLLFWRWISMHISEMFPHVAMLQRLTGTQTDAPLFMWNWRLFYTAAESYIEWPHNALQSLLPKTYSTKLGYRTFLHKKCVGIFFAVTFIKYAMTNLVLMVLCIIFVLFIGSGWG